ncbi:MAG: hypothetical protein Q8P24_02480 [Desulfobacterales bacterium]|nr:hypothetical protein [Desulfobacterales bacterium]
MSGLPWFRLYHEILDDPKVGTLEDGEFRLFIEILCLACEAGDGGNTQLTVTETAWKLRRNVSVTFQKLLQRGLVTLQKRFDGEETVFVPNWNKRQFQSDSSTKRVEKYRTKRFSNGEATVTPPLQ